MGGHFKLKKLLGAGSYGTVYLAKRVAKPNPIGAVATSNDGENFAVKVMPRPEEGSVEKWMSDEELRLQATVAGHRNILQVREASYETLKGEKFGCIRMDLCEGGDMNRAVLRGMLMLDKEEQVRSALLQVIDGVMHCHEQGVYHRDLKPANILCSMEGEEVRVRIADFGLATQEAMMSDGTVAGTKSFMPPECICPELRRPNYSPALQDLWAVGMIVAGTLSGEFPWRTARMSDPSFRFYMENPTRLGELIPRASDEVVQILQYVFRTDPFSRIMLEQLREVVGKVPLFKNEKRGFFDKLFGF
ncbi:kinase-like protein [Dendrothele bispora CBS 962.96]|uniref:non-specific serine/threonine protein kinase n=1 Tax=Dendrothele bispora (strain CBS 962.96) TaxID=1314807 RepID=A0A4S8MBP4_DENBC|nr:kinase-like protein [Dendrothele bispora CBS 962.96]